MFLFLDQCTAFIQDPQFTFTNVNKTINTTVMH